MSSQSLDSESTLGIIQNNPMNPTSTASAEITSSRLLLIIDPQLDFINGTLPVPGAVEAMNALATYITTNSSAYCLKIITADSHPYNHFSFLENGGQWPRHCVHDKRGVESLFAGGGSPYDI